MPHKILILGATSAIAQEAARRYAARGAQLYLVGRSQSKLQALVEELGAAVLGSQSADLDDLPAHAGLLDAAWEQVGGFDKALIAHGYLGDQLRAEQDLEYNERILNTNFRSPVSLLLHLANQMEEQGHGHLAAITSVAGERGRPRNYCYGAAKGGLTRYLQGLRSRFYGSGIYVHNIKLGPVPTPMSEGHPQNFLWGEKGKAAASIVRALEGRRHAVYVPGHWALVMAIVRGLPEFVFQRFGFLADR
jgi:decaprenylphospho-beta-D-erythro-pentofuranosid-2-ulose 2-reductase